MNELTLNFNFKARYFKFGQITDSTQQLWFVLHGYGQLAQYFLKKFKSFEQRNMCVIAPEGLSHFYLEDINTRSQGGSNRVGATWMTRENRLTDIENYISYLDKIYEIEIKDRTELPQITLLGFSQGVATVARWAMHGKIKFNRMILWAGILPPIWTSDMAKKYLEAKR